MVRILSAIRRRRSWSALAGLLCAGLAFGQPPAQPGGARLTPEQRQQLWQQMSPEQREAFRSARTPEERQRAWQALRPDQKREMWQTLSPEQRELMMRRVPSEERHQMLQQMSPQEREAMRQRFLQQRDQRAAEGGQRRLTPEERQHLRDQVREAQGNWNPKKGGGR